MYIPFGKTNLPNNNYPERMISTSATDPQQDKIGFLDFEPRDLSPGIEPCPIFRWMCYWIVWIDNII